jgi:hypothetical protein
MLEDSKKNSNLKKIIEKKKLLKQKQHKDSLKTPFKLEILEIKQSFVINE